MEPPDASMQQGLGLDADTWFSHWIFLAGIFKPQALVFWKKIWNPIKHPRDKYKELVDTESKKDDEMASAEAWF